MRPWTTFGRLLQARLLAFDGLALSATLNCIAPPLVLALAATLVLLAVATAEALSG